MKTSCIGIIVTAALLLWACSDAGSPGRNAPKSFTDFETLAIEQSPCLFDCPVFELTIHSDGRVRHSGPSFEDTGGPHESRIDGRGLAAIAKALRDARFDAMRDRYQDEADGCENVFTDMSTLGFSVSRRQGLRNKSVVLYAGCLGPTVPTERINVLIKAIDQVTGTGALLEQRKQARRPDGEGVAPST